MGLLLVLALCLPQEVQAQNPVMLMKSVSQNEEGGQSPLQPQPTMPDQSSGTNVPSLQEAYRFAEAGQAVVADVPNALQAMQQAITGASAIGDPNWVIWAVVASGLSILLGQFASVQMQGWSNRRFFSLFQGSLQHRSGKISFVMARAIVMFIALAITGFVAGCSILIMLVGQPPARMTAMLILMMFLIYKSLRILIQNLLVPYTPECRLLYIGESEAKSLFKTLMVVASLCAVVLGFFLWMGDLGVARNTLVLLQVLLSFIASSLFSGVVLLHRETVAKAIKGGELEKGDTSGRGLLASFWHVLAIAYFWLAFLVTVHRTVLELPSSTGLVIAPIKILLLAFVFYGLLLLVVDRFLLPRLDTPANLRLLAKQIMKREGYSGHHTDEELSLSQAGAEAMEREEAREPFRGLLDHGAQILTFLMALGYLIVDWGFPIISSESVLGNLFEVSMISFFGYMAYQAVALAIDRKMEQEKPEVEEEEAEHHDMGGQGESRIATLLPILRNFLLISIAVICSMVVLSQLGVNIAPLFAGAGVVGLAVGFGAQTLIRDIFSGAFFLIDDAFRKGEYIDIGDVKGTVERISIRSMQLRHHNGPLNTVPFGEVKFVKNFSRDWAMMKLTFRVTYDTDVERVRKLIKKFGQELLTHPDYGSKFLQPVKSQGVTSMEDSAMIVRVKFMTKPGDQFELRKVVYTGIRDIFTREGIQFAHKEVKVRLSENDETRKLSEEEKQAVAGAVLPVIEAEQQEGQPVKKDAM
ncbi:mechanosensitive ion channel family protein [Flexibacterium corallicola]|uniref:mechanosensitive ion channel family protein n=1 Tax=Flexibacterium corallicola TaxID=3037259 RepID=UPI00286FA21F|nr:mechanosensitive ion channel domain-containing protein [Pseudovibrio sp. M1P-2-3]